MNSLVVVHKICRNGHVAERDKRGECRGCVRERTRRWQRKNRAYSVKYSKKWQADNPEKHKKNMERHREKNKEIILLRNKKWRENNYEKWRHGQRIARAKRRASTPVWVDHKELKIIYDNCPVGYQVDHIIPVNGKFVCGLHVPINLQYLTPEENKKKSNSFDEKEFLLARPLLALTNAGKASQCPV